MAEQIRFTSQQIERFNDRIENLVGDEQCRNIFKGFLTDSRRQNLLNALKLWEEANASQNFNEDFFFELFDDVSGFNEQPLLSINEHDHKLSYIKSECCRIMEPVKHIFIDYLNRHYRRLFC